MDPSGADFRLLADAGAFAPSSDAAWDDAMRVLRLRSRGVAAGFPDDRAAARAAAEAQPPATIDAWGSWARASADRRTLLAGGAGDAPVAIVPCPGLTLAAGETIADAAWGADGVLYLAVVAGGAGRVVLVDRRGRWAPVSLRAPGLCADRVAACPGGGCWALDRAGRTLARVRGLPLPETGLIARDPSLGRPIDEDSDPARIAVAPVALAPGEAIDLAVDGDGRAAVLLWPADADAQVQRSDGLTAEAPLTLVGARAPFALAWAGGERWLVLGVGREEARSYSGRSGAVEPDGERWPLPGWDAGRFVRSAAPPAVVGTGAGAAWAPLALAHLALPALARRALVPAAVPCDAGAAATVWHRVFLEACIPAGCAITVHCAAGDDPGDPPRRFERLLFPGPRTAVDAFARAYAPVAVTVALRTVDELETPSVLAAVEAALEAALGRFAPDGSERVPGDAVSAAALAAVVGAVPGVRALRGLRLFGRAEDGAWVEAPEAAGDHVLTLEPGQWPDAAAIVVESGEGPAADAAALVGVDPEPVGTWVPLASEVPLHPGLLAHPRVAGERGLFTALIQRRGRRVRALAGRWLWLRVELHGDGVRGPELAALRVHAPRVGWRDRYLPEPFRETLHGPDADARGAATGPDFLERLLAIAEGVLTPIEDRIAHAHLMSDPRACPREALDWLASWLGLALEPGLDERRRRAWIAHAVRAWRRRGTMAGLLLALDLATGGEVARGGVVVVEDFRLRRTFSTILGADLADEQDPLLQGIVASGNSFVGDTLFVGDEARRELLALFRADRITATDQAAVRAFSDQLAHRVTVLVHRELAEDELRLVRRVVELETPAHLVARVLTATPGLLVGLSALVDVDTFLREPPPRAPVRVDGTTVGLDGYVTDLPTLDPRLDPA